MNTKDRYLNIQYGTLIAEVNITGISRLGGVQDAIKAKLGETIPVAAALIQLYTTNKDHLITDLDDIIPEKTPQYYQKLTQGGSCVVIGTSPPPTVVPDVGGQQSLPADSLKELKELTAEALTAQLLAYEKHDELVDLQRKLLDTLVPFVKNSLDKQWNLEASSKSTQIENDEFRTNVFAFYQMSTVADPIPANVFCHFLGISIPTNLATVAHIFPRRFRHNEWVPVADIDDVQNTLVLFKPIERAFDTGRLCFVWCAVQDQFRFHILDPKLLNMTVEKLSNHSFENKNKNWKNPNTVIPLNDTFQSYHGKYLHFNGLKRPYKRCMTFHAQRARHEAIKKKWIKPEDLSELDEDDVWSPGAMEDKRLVELIQNWKVMENDLI